MISTDMFIATCLMETTGRHGHHSGGMFSAEPIKSFIILQLQGLLDDQQDFHFSSTTSFLTANACWGGGGEDRVDGC